MLNEFEFDALTDFLCIHLPKHRGLCNTLAIEVDKYLDKISGQQDHKCPQCGHPASMHWYPDHPDLDMPGYRRTTACRDCLPRNVISGPTNRRGTCNITKQSILETYK